MSILLKAIYRVSASQVKTVSTLFTKMEDILKFMQNQNLPMLWFRPRVFPPKSLVWKVIGSWGHIHQWPHTLVGSVAKCVFRGYSLVSGGKSLGPWPEGCISNPACFLSSPFSDCRDVNSFPAWQALHFVISALDTVEHGLSLLKLWTKINLPF